MRKFELIDALRAIAALLVLTYHVVEVGQWTAFPVTGPGLLVRFGWIGVDLFFVISGFVIGRAAIRAAQEQQPGWRERFAERRLRRIVPLYLLTAVVFTLFVDSDVLRHGWKTAAWQIGVHLMFVHNLHPSSHGAIDGPNWSVALEMQFYLLIALCAPWLARVSALRIVAFWMLLAVAWRYGTTIVLAPGTASPYLQHVAESQLPGALSQFSLGILLAKRELAGGLRPNWRGFGTCSALAAILLITAWKLLLANSTYWDNALMIVGWRPLFAVGLAALVAAAVTAPVNGGRLIRPLRYLGEISYGIYLWHLPVLLTLIEKTPWRGKSLMMATLAGTIALAALSWHFYERRWLVPSTSPPGSAPR
ncbi:MAG: acyltransferase [Ramlibacter sp.]|nr:acyltransferase [Ramlibacter sp.]